MSILTNMEKRDLAESLTRNGGDANQTQENIRAMMAEISKSEENWEFDTDDVVDVTNLVNEILTS